MPLIATNTYRLPVLKKLSKGKVIIAASTNNSNVPDNEVPLAAVVAAQETLAAAEAEYRAILQTATQLLLARDAAVAAWNLAINGLAAFTECATQSDACKILSAGFDVRSAKTPPQPVAEVSEVKVSYTGNPGHSEVRWKRDPHASAYRVQRSPEQITDTSWEDVGTVTEASYTGNGVIPGQQYWYRVAAVNRLGQGPWSQPALRPVM